MDHRLKSVFAKHLRSDGLTADGRGVSRTSTGLDIAARLIDDAADTYADEIIKLMKPYCYPFDVAPVRKRLELMGQRQRRARSKARVDNDAHASALRAMQ